MLSYQNYRRKIMTRTIFTVFLLSLCSLASAQVEWNDMPLTDGTYVEGTAPFKQSDYEIKVPAGVGLEFKVAMDAGDMIVYSWSSDVSDPALMDVEFHGHTEAVDGKGDLMFYNVHNEGKESGTLKAPFSGIHGWWLNNRSDKDVMVTLTVAGFYEDAE